MTPEQIALVKSSWRKTTSASVAELFYAKLFEIDPNLKALFYSDMLAQQKKFADTLTMITEYFDNPAALAPKVQALGIRHVGYGVKDEHYEVVEQALLWALKQSLGREFSDATEQAWILAYRTLADAMSTADIDSIMYPC